VLIQQLDQSSGHMSLAPDGTQLLFDEIQVAEQPRNSILPNTVGQAIVKSSLWVLPLKAENRSNTKFLNFGYRYCLQDVLPSDD
jgi:hypothetical protein